MSFAQQIPFQGDPIIDKSGQLRRWALVTNEPVLTLKSEAGNISGKPNCITFHPTGIASMDEAKVCNQASGFEREKFAETVSGGEMGAGEAHSAE